MNVNDEANYQRALDRIWDLMQRQPQPGTPEGDELDMLATLVEAYEEIHVPMQPSDPVEFLKYKIREGNLREKDLVPYIGDEDEVSNVLTRRRELTVGMVQRLSRGLNIPISLLIPAA